MKAVIPILLAVATFAFGEPLEFALEPNDDHNAEYGTQLLEKFNALLKSDMDLKARFEAFEVPPKERAGGRYLGFSGRPLLLHQSEDVDFRDDGGRRDYTRTVVLYYSFAEGFHKGMQEASGVFAVFHLVGHQSYDHGGDGEFKLAKHSVTAKFDGFHKTLNAESGPGE